MDPRQPRSERIGILSGRSTLIPFHIHTYLNDRLIGSEAPRSHEQVVEIVECYGASTSITLTESFRDFDLSGLQQHHVPIADCPKLTDIACVVGIALVVLARGGAAWIHCSRGLDRSGVMVAAVLVRQGIPVEEALGEVESKFPSYRQSRAYKTLWSPYRQVVRAFARCARPPSSR